MELITRTKNNLKMKFKMKDLDDPKFFLGITFDRSNDGIVMYHHKYSLELISEMGLTGLNLFKLFQIPTQD